MSAILDKALMKLSLQEEDQLFDMPDLPEYISMERNVLSIIGRVLNPECQKMADLILDMLRKWQKVEKVRGVALSKERFQFIFKHEHDLEEVLEKGAHTFNEWSLVTERWEENPPPDYLQFITVWVQIRNIPVNYYTVKAITALGELVKRIVEVAFDPNKSQRREYVRVQVRLNVSKPLRKSKLVNLPNKESVIIEYHYERIQKRCFTCQRLIHEQDKCPLFIQSRRDKGGNKNNEVARKGESSTPVLTPEDPLFGVLKESQVGVNPSTGRPRITEVVLQEMRNYLLTANESERHVREERVKVSVAEVENDPMAEKTILSLEPAAVIIADIDKGKGIVFDYETQAQMKSSVQRNEDHPKLINASFKAASISKKGFFDWQTNVLTKSSASYPSIPHFGFTVQRATLSEFGSFETSMKNKGRKPRKRESKNKRFNKRLEGWESEIGYNQELLFEGDVGRKRKAEHNVDIETKWLKVDNKKVIPTMGLPNSQ